MAHFIDCTNAVWWCTMCWGYSWVARILFSWTMWKVFTLYGVSSCNMYNMYNVRIKELCSAITTLVDIARVIRCRRGESVLQCLHAQPWCPVCMILWSVSQPWRGSNCIILCVKHTGGLELEGVEVKIQLDDQNKADIKDLIPKQVHVHHCNVHTAGS